jgi:hypothetical protein
MKTAVLAIVAGLLGMAPASAQSNIENARLEERSAGDLARTFRQLAGEAGPFWIGYAVAAESRDWNACCWNDDDGRRDGCGRCSLEDRAGNSISIGDNRRRTVQLEASATAIVLFRIEQGHVQKIRALSDSCEIDAGGRRLVWLAGVDPAASVSLLRSVVQSSDPESGGRHVVTEGLLAISAHRGTAAVTTLIELARDAAQPRVRSDALFWLAQRAGAKAAGAITDAIANDPDTKVKERAVFALSQLPRDEGVPKLIDVARTNRNPRVRQQAVFWLGQSRDPRALKFFEELLLK